VDVMRSVGICCMPIFPRWCFRICCNAFFCMFIAHREMNVIVVQKKYVVWAWLCCKNRMTMISHYMMIIGRQTMGVFICWGRLVFPPL
jgi:hypothetical protein